MAGRGRRNADEVLIAGLAGGLTVEQAAEKAGVAARTAHRRLADPAFEQRVQEARSELLGRTIGWLSQSGVSAVQTLTKLSLNGQSETVRVSASRALLEFLFRGQELQTLEQRISELERRLDERTSHAKPRSPVGSGRTTDRRSGSSVNDNGHPGPASSGA